MLQYGRLILFQGIEGPKNTLFSVQHIHFNNLLSCLVQIWKCPQITCIHCKICGLHSGDYEECCPLGYKNPLRTSQETHYVSATEPSRLMLCKVWGFHGGDYEECPLPGYKNPIRTSHAAHYVSAAESSRLMLCKIWGFHGGDYEEFRLLGCDALWLLWEPSFRRNVLPPSSG
jgi:hypothetical protein